MTEYDLKWLEDAIKKANTEITIIWCDNILNSIELKEGEGLLHVLIDHFKKDLEIKKKIIK